MNKNTKIATYSIISLAVIIAVVVIGYSHSFQAIFVRSTSLNKSNHDAQFVSQNVPTTMTPGETARVEITMKNQGITRWKKADNFKLGSISDPADTWGVQRVTLGDSETINPMQEKTFSFDITAPSVNGSYEFKWRMLVEGENWFGSSSTPTSITVDDGTGDNTSLVRGMSGMGDYTDYPDLTVEDFINSFDCEYLQCNINGCRCAGDDGGDGGGSVNIDDTPSTITGDMVVTAHDAVYDVLSPTESTARQTTRGPQFSDLVYDAANKKMYLNDHAGVYAFALNKLQSAVVTPIELLGGGANMTPGPNFGKYTNCIIVNEDERVDRCVSYTGDAGGYQRSRALNLGMIDEGQVVVRMGHNTTHPGAEIVFQDENGTFDVESEFYASQRGPNYGVITREGGGVAYLGGASSSLKGDFVWFFSPDNKRYGLLQPVGSSDLGDFILVDITNNPIAPRNAGKLSDSGHEELYAYFKAMCGGRTSVGPNMSYCRQMLYAGATPENRVVIEINGEHALYDFTDPENPAKIASWVPTGSFSYLGVVDGSTATLSNGVLYVTYHATNAAGLRNTPLEDLNPTEVAQGFNSRGSSTKAYLGQVWKLDISTGVWEKVVDVPATSGRVFDGKLFILDNIIDASQWYTHYYNGDSWDAHVTAEKQVYVYDLENKSLSTNMAVFVPEKCTDIYNGNKIAVTIEGSDYYMYIPLKDCGAAGEVPKTYIWGYQITQCSGTADCSSKAADYTPTTVCVPNCDGKSCGMSDGCGEYCVEDDSCQAGFQCLPRHYSSNATAPSCKCPYDVGQLASCTPGAERLYILGTHTDGRCTYRPEECTGVIGCSIWVPQTSFPGLWWREEVEAQAAGREVEGIEQCAYEPTT